MLLSFGKTLRSYGAVIIRFDISWYFIIFDHHVFFTSIQRDLQINHWFRILIWHLMPYSWFPSTGAIGEGPKSDQCLPLSLTHCRLVDLMPVNDATCLMMSQQLLKAAHSCKKLSEAGGEEEQEKFWCVSKMKFSVVFFLLRGLQLKMKPWL